MSMTSWRPLWVGLWLGLFAGCADGGSGQICTTEECPEDCDDVTGERCDILDPSCRERILRAVMCVRGSLGEMPEVRVLTEEQYREELADPMPDAGGDAAVADLDAGEVADAESGLDGSADAALAQDAGADATEDAQVKPARDTWSAGLWLMGLLERTQDLDEASVESQAAAVAGYYASTTKSITLIDRGTPQDSDSAMSILAHELVHALQDQQMGLFELNERTGGSYDSSYSRGCLVEGEATLYESLAMGLLLGFSVEPRGWDVGFAQRLKYARRGVITADSPFASLWLLQYPVGGRYVADVWLDRGARGVAQLYGAPPPSTIHWMHGYRATQNLSSPLVLALACTTARPPEGYRLETAWSMGPFALFAMLARELREDGVYQSEAWWQTALAWRQDKLSVLVDQSEQVAASWRIRMSSPELAQSLADALLQGSSLDLEIKVRGAELELLAAEDPAALEAWQGTDPELCNLER